MYPIIYHTVPDYDPRAVLFVNYFPSTDHIYLLDMSKVVGIDSG